MTVPTPLDPQTLGVENDPYDVAGGLRIFLDRAPYLELLTTILLSLIAALWLHLRMPREVEVGT